MQNLDMPLGKYRVRTRSISTDCHQRQHYGIEFAIGWIVTTTAPSIPSIGAELILARQGEEFSLTLNPPPSMRGLLVRCKMVGRA
jgi:hypothetical protein